jgi:hypothetical protein
MPDNYQFLLDKTIETQSDTSKRLAKNTIFQGIAILLAIVISFNLIEVQPIIKEYLKIENSKFILLLLPFYLTYLFVEFGYLLSLYIGCGQTKTILTRKLIDDCKTEIDFTEVETGIINTTFKTFNFFEPMANPFIKNISYSFINYFPTIFAILLIAFNHYSILYITNELITNKYIFLLISLLFLGIIITFYLHFAAEHKGRNTINRTVPWAGIIVSCCIILYFVGKTIMNF